MNDYMTHNADAERVNPNLRYAVEHLSWMVWPLAWVLVGAVATFIRHL